MDLITRTIKECESRDWYAPRAAITEQLIRGRGGAHPTTRDFLGIIDLVVFPPGRCLGLQVTSSDNHAARRTKILDNPHAPFWLKAGNELQLWSWRANKNGVWMLRHERFNLGDVRTGGLVESYELGRLVALTQEPE